jgi:Na+/phosphate symporter
MNDPDLSAPALPQEQHTSGGMETPLAQSELVLPVEPSQAWWERTRLAKIGLFFASLFLFALAISLMKEGVRGIAPLVRDMCAVTNPANCLGFGWLIAYVIMSGSPVAAAALTFFDAGVVDKLGAFAMITGSRLGAGFIVLLIGFLYVLRGRDRATSLGMGLLSLAVTITTYLPGFFLGAIILQAGWLDRLQLRSGALLSSAVDLAIEPITGAIVDLLPSWAVFFVGLGIIMLSFSLFDRCLPKMTIKGSQVGWMSRLVYRPGVMFALGALVTLVSMSVSLSLSLLVPMSHRGFVRRENVIPYIMGANITTFIDTLFVAVLLDNPPAFTIVFAGMVSITVVSAIILITVYRRYERAILDSMARVTATNRNLAVFMAAIFAVPVILILV